MNRLLKVVMTLLFYTCASVNISGEQRPWGSYEILNESETYKIKKIVVLPQKRLSLQRHKFRAEYWVIIQGKGLVTLDHEQITVSQGSSIFVKQGAIHRIENTGDENLEFIEIQTGSYFGEDDIERLEDDFGRK